YYVYSSATVKKYLYQVYPNFSKDRVAGSIKVKVISIGPGGQTVGLDERKWLSQEAGAPTYTLIYGGKIAMIAVNSDNRPIGILIEDKNIFQTQKMIFEFTWSKL
ncbi:MAG TPA: TrmB family transcriptional regulator, partial [Patescibacteria group bacterium]|nr:TrmB family transcriptional regulator [Patescibacteria group bacterium]